MSDPSSGMRTIGLIGGMSWESTATYYQIINQTIRERCGGLHSAKIALYSLDFAEIEACQASGDWEKSADILSDAARRLEAAGADFLVICTNTMHKVAPTIQARSPLPLLHIADVTAEALHREEVRCVALLGTSYTMTQDFYMGRLEKNGLRVLVPDAPERDRINAVIYDELCCGKVNETSRRFYAEVIRELRARGAEAVILGCTEIGLLIRQEDSVLPVFDTTLLHARAAALRALAAEATHN